MAVLRMVSSIVLLTSSIAVSYKAHAETLYAVCVDEGDKLAISGPISVNLDIDGNFYNGKQDNSNLSVQWAKYTQDSSGSYCFLYTTMREAQRSIDGPAHENFKRVDWQFYNVPVKRPSNDNRNGYEYCWMENEREPQRDMPVFASSIFAYDGRGDMNANRVRSAWLAYVRGLPGFRGMTNGGCGHAATMGDAKAAQDREIDGSLRSYSWAYRKETAWSM